jgi:hypothetical protein
MGAANFANRLANWIPVREIASDEGFVDDRDGRCRRLIEDDDVAPQNDRNTVS